MANTPFATKEELAAYWRALTGDEPARADVMLALASDRLRLMAEDVDINLDTKVSDSEAFKSTIRWVVMEAVKRALISPTDQQAVDSLSKTAGPYSENYKFSNPTGDLWFKKSELSALGLYGRQTLSTINTSRRDIYS